MKSSSSSSAAAVWAPWLAAPLFALLPIGGCGLAGGLRPAAAHPPAAHTPAATAAAPVPTAPVPAAAVVPVVRIAGRQVAPGRAAH